MSRRSWAAGAFAAMALAGTALAQPADFAPAARFIERTGRELGGLIAANPDSVTRRDRLALFLDRVVGVDGLGRFCLGRYWQAATPAQQAEYRRLFRITLADNVASRLGAATADVAKVQTDRPERKGDEIWVPTLIERPNNRPNRVVWVVVPAGDSYKIVDVVAEGISLRLTFRSDYVSFLASNNGNVSVLLRALQQKASPG
jgi:phospholipid transport system substrate-binding protein